ncbi:MAG: TrkH family potassium uptake protein [Gammaproteobacteria bacterium]
MPRWLAVCQGFGKTLSCFGVLMALPAVVALIFGDGLARHYLLSALFAVVCGVVLAFVIGRRRTKSELGARDGFLLVLLIWTLLPAFAAIPLMAAVDGLDFTRGYFEAASGLTASGGTVLRGLDNLPPSVNFWRAEMIWLGGMGLIVLFAAVLPLLGVGGRGMFQTETAGPLKDQKLRPNIAHIAKELWLMYAALTALCAFCYFAAGMTFLDAVMHSFTTMGLGGFSSHDASYAYFDSQWIEAVAVVFMIIAGMSFTTHITAFGRKSFRPYSHQPECRAYLAILFVAIVIVVCYLRLSGVYDNWLSAFRYGVFNTVSIATTTGYSNTDFGAWPLAAPLFILLLANITACSGSTGGGIKLIRALIALRQTTAERDKLLHPSAWYDTKVGRALPQRTLNSVLYFILAYFAAATLVMLLLAASGMDFLTAFSAAVASISNTGPGLGEVGPSSTYGDLTNLQIWLCTLAMLLGRLELMVFLVVIHRGFWKY